MLSSLKMCFHVDDPPRRSQSETSKTSSNKRTHEATSVPTYVEDLPRRSKSARITNSFGIDFLTYILENELRTIKEALSSPDVSLWMESMRSKIDSIMKNHT